MSPALNLGHELAHAGLADTSLVLYSLSMMQNLAHPEYDFVEEERVITGPEADAANALGESYRYTHQPRPTRVEPNSTSRVCR
jgi:hypothetical protein